MPPSSHSFSRRLVRGLVWAGAGLVIAAILWRFPLVRLRRLDATAPLADAFDPRGFAAGFWTADLEPALAAAADARLTLAAIARDPGEACRTHGRSVGLSRSCLYLVRGRGTIAQVGPAEVRVTLDGDDGADMVDVALAIGLVFGSTVRDVTGTIDPASRSDSRDLAAVSNEINQIVLREVIAPLKTAAAVGGTIEFVACGQVQGKLPAGKPWSLIPLRAVVTPPRPSSTTAAPTTAAPTTAAPTTAPAAQAPSRGAGT